MASRSLQTRLDVTRPDPENREFKHPNILDWTDTHRAQILNALFTVLLGNPELRKPHDAQAKTRFKQWWRLIGSAVEHAAEVMKAPTDFKKQFLEQEEVDDGGVSLADALIILADKWPQSFLANDLAEFINKEFPDDIQRQVREFLYPNSTDPKAKFSSKSVGTALGRHIDEPVASGGKVYTLRRYQELHGKSAAKYRVDIGVRGCQVSGSSGCPQPFFTRANTIFFNPQKISSSRARHRAEIRPDNPISRTSRL